MVFLQGDAEMIGDFFLLRLPPRSLLSSKMAFSIFASLFLADRGCQSLARSSSSTAPRILKRA